MTDCVLDASAVVMAVGGKTAEAAALRSRLLATWCHAPHLVDAEVGNVLRRHERDGRLTGTEAALALTASGSLVDRRYPSHGPLSALAWRWRQNLTFYDALYVALAGSMDLPLLTADPRLAGSPDLRCAVELV